MRAPCAALALLVAPCVFGTTLVGIWSPDRVFLAADSRVVSGHGGRASTGCKIVHEGDLFFAISGLARDEASRYDAQPLIAEALRGKAPLQAKLERVVAAIEPSLRRALQQVERDSPADFAYLKTGRPAFQAIVAGTERGIPVMGLASLQVTAHGELAPHAVVVDGSDGRGTRVVYAGQQSRIREYLRTHQDWLGSDYSAFVRNLVQLEIEADSGWVGGPVDVIQAGPAGSLWLQRKTACAQ